MAHSLPYSIPYIASSTPQYMLAPHTHHHRTHAPGGVHMVSTAQIRSEQPQRKRPKYTRSKTGCLTCRGKKIKCDEVKPKCQRCSHGQRECAWPDPAPTKKKTPARRSSATQDNVSAADSASRSSDSSQSRDATPGTREVEGTVKTPSITSTDRRYSGSQGYSYAVESGAPIPVNRRQTENSYSQAAETNSSAPMSSGSNMSHSYYDFHNSSNGSISSRSNSRPSTANSLPPSHFNAPSSHAGMEARDYPHWEAMPTHRAEASYTFYPSS